MTADFEGCPPQGDGGDRALNVLKNRVDEGSYASVPFDSVLALRWPAGVEQVARARWTRADAADVARYEGIPIAVEGYLASAKLEGPESPNCHGAATRLRDFHIWLTRNPGEDRRGSLVVEMTPRVRAAHRGWTVAALRRVAQARDRVRVSGWLLLDQEHPDQVGRTRGTIWEVHPITRFEVQRRGRWVALDDLRP